MPQRPWQDLTLVDFVPSAEDAAELKKRALQYMMTFLVNHFSSLSNLKQFIPPASSTHPVAADEVVPMTVLLKDEKFIADTIDILAQLTEDADLNGDPQVRHVLNNLLTTDCYTRTTNIYRLLLEISSHVEM